MPLSPAVQDRITHIFFPNLESKTRDVLASGGRFVYYTTADTATNILKNKQIWLRNTAAMNDYLEVDYGFECLNGAYEKEPGESFNTEVAPLVWTVSASS